MRKAGQDLRVVRCEQLTHSAARVKGVHQPRPGAVVVPPAEGGGRWPYHPPWTPAGKGSKGWEHRATEAVLPERTSQGGKPRGGKRELSEKQAERSSGPLDVRREGAVPAERDRSGSAGSRSRSTPLFLLSRITLPPPETERCAVPSLSRPPTQPRLPPPPCATRVSAKGERKRDKSQAHGA